MAPLQIRKQMVDALRLDMIGPEDGLGSPEEILPEPPSRWYLTGFIVPLDADDDQKADEAAADELDEIPAGPGIDDGVAPEPAAARRSYFPSFFRPEPFSQRTGEEAEGPGPLGRLQNETP